MPPDTAPAPAARSVGSSAVLPTVSRSCLVPRNDVEIVVDWRETLGGTVDAHALGRLFGRCHRSSFSVWTPSWMPALGFEGGGQDMPSWRGPGTRTPGGCVARKARCASAQSWCQAA